MSTAARWILAAEITPERPEALAFLGDDLTASGYMVDWFGWLIGRLSCCLIAWFVWFVRWLIGRLIGWMVWFGWLVCLLVGCLVCSLLVGQKEQTARNR